MKIKPILAAILAVLLLTACAPITGVRALAADEREYTNVLDDLQKDGNFNVNDYLINEKDYSISVIQIAESTDGELFVYTYQPAFSTTPLEATSINISTAINDNLHYENYALKLLDSNGVFVKYLVKDMTVREEVVRYYDISAIYRAWNEELGDAAEDKVTANVISEIACRVGSCWTACTVNGEVSYYREDTNLIEVTSKYVSYVQYNNRTKPAWCNWGLGENDAVISWYVAFDTDIPIDELFEADVTYVYETRYGGLEGEIIDTTISLSKWFDNHFSKTENDREGNKETVTVKHSEKVNIQVADNNYFVKHRFKWNRIQSIDEFKEENLSPEAISNLSDSKWVLRFAETKLENAFLLVDEASLLKTYTNIYDVSVLRMKYKSEGKVYNQGVVDNKQYKRPGSKPDNKDTPLTFWEKVLAVLQMIPWWVWLIVLSPIIVPLAVKLIIALIESRKGSKKR